MQDIEHDMDDLLRKAAQNYPLNSGDGDWDAVAAQLTPQAVPVSRKGNARKYGLSILFLLMSLFTADLVFKQQEDMIRQSATPAGTGKNNITKYETGRQSGEYPGFEIKTKKPGTEINFDHKPSITQPAVPITDDQNAFPQKSVTALIQRMSKPAGMASSIIDSERKPGFETIIKTDTIAKSEDPPATTSTRKRRTGLYLGVVLGPEFNQVKGQRLEKSGFDAGVIAGYRFNNKLSIETGLLLSRKYYYSEGRYFKMDMPGMKLLSLEGSCTVFEIPLKLKYDVLTKNKMNLYTSAGLSTYLLKKEENNYLFLVNGTEQSMVNSYNEACRYFAATVDLSIGYEHTFGKNTRLRIEPYLQLPMRGIGVGTMPVKSAGVHVGLIRSISQK